MPMSTATATATEPDPKSSDGSEVGSFDHQETECLSRLFSALGDPSRLTILRVLDSEGAMCVSDLANAVGLSISAVSHQLRLLRDRELIKARRKGREVRYSISDDHVAMMLDVGLEHAMHDCSKRRRS